MPGPLSVHEIVFWDIQVMYCRHTSHVSASVNIDNNHNDESESN